MPTVLELTRAKRPAQLRGFPVPPAPGRSIVPTFVQDVTVPHDFLWWEHEGNRAIRAGDWKLVPVAKGDWELYNLATDRGETLYPRAGHV